ncbi:MAG: type II secretion system protein J [Deltaproteobacteria bacterium]
MYFDQKMQWITFKSRIERKGRRLEKQTGQRGYLVVEYMVSLSLMIVVVLTLFALLDAACTAAGLTGTDAELHYSARSAMLIIKDDVLGAEKLQITGNGRRLRVQSSDEVVSYYIENHQLYRHGPGKLPVAENAESVSFRMISPGLVEVMIRVGSNGRSYQIQNAFQVRYENM